MKKVYLLNPTIQYDINSGDWKGRPISFNTSFLVYLQVTAANTILMLVIEKLDLFHATRPFWYIYLPLQSFW